MAKKALTVNQILNKKYDLFDFQGDWLAAFDRPEKTGKWFICGASASGKTTFVLQLVNYLVSMGNRALYWSLEEGTSHTLQNSLRNANLSGTGIKFLEGYTMEALETEYLNKQRPPHVVVFDSIQYTGLNFEQYMKFTDRYINKVLFIVISQSENGKPLGATALRVQFDAALKIWVEGYKAFSKGRYIGSTGEYVIWEEKAAEYWLEKE
jgi:GTPase SAR1 family protein